MDSTNSDLVAAFLTISAAVGTNSKSNESIDATWKAFCGYRDRLAQQAKDELEDPK